MAYKVHDSTARVHNRFDQWSVICHFLVTNSKSKKVVASFWGLPQMERRLRPKDISEQKKRKIIFSLTKFQRLIGDNFLSTSNSSSPETRSGTAYASDFPLDISSAIPSSSCLFPRPLPFKLLALSSRAWILRGFSKATLRRSIGSSGGRCLAILFDGVL